MVEAEKEEHSCSFTLEAGHFRWEEFLWVLKLGRFGKAVPVLLPLEGITPMHRPHPRVCVTLGSSPAPGLVQREINELRGNQPLGFEHL